MTQTSSVPRQPAASPPPAPSSGPPDAGRLPLVLPWAVLGFGLFLVLQGLGALLAQVQIATDAAFGAMEALASGFGPGVVDRTQELLNTWSVAAQDPLTHDLIISTATAYTLIDMVFLVTYVTVLIGLWRRVRRHLPPGAGGDPGTRNRLRRAAYWRRGPMLAVGAAIADAGENIVRYLMVRQAVAHHAVPDPVIRVAWALTTTKWLLIITCLVLLLVLLHDTGLLMTWLRRTVRAAWRLRIVVVAVGLFAALLLADATGQAVDLARRWVNDPTGYGSAALVLAGSVLLGLSVWLYARRVVLSDQTQRATNVRWTWLLIAVIVVTVALRVFVLPTNEILAVSAIAALILLLGWVSFRTPITAGASQAEVTEAARARRSSDAAAPESEDVLAVRRTTRALAVTAPLTVLMLTASAYAPVMIVLPLSGQQYTRVFGLSVIFVVGAVFGAPLAIWGGCVLLRTWDGELSRTPGQLEVRYLVGAAAVLVGAVASIVGALVHWPMSSALLVIATFLATAMLALGEAQRWSETHTAPPGLLAIGFSRLPVSTLLVVALIVSSFLLNDGSAHDVHRQQALPDGLTTSDGSRTGVDLQKAFGEWATANCADSEHSGRTVPMIIVAAPGGGIRAAYWTASTLTALFGADRSSTVSNCAGTAPFDRIFAMGGASGGSLGVLAYEAGLSGPRAKDWYVSQLGQPDFLTDPLTWMLTVDLARGFIGYGFQDRARRLEDSFARHVTGMGDDFLAGTWGLGGRAPLMLLTGTQVESGCRLNLSGLRLTAPLSRAGGVGCATLATGTAQFNAAITTDLLDVVCDSDGAHPASLSRATAALLSARFPYVSPSGQMYGCVDVSAKGTPAGQANSTAIVDGGYAENTGIGMLLSLWPRLEPLIAAHNAQPHTATIVPVFVEVDNDYAKVAVPTQRGRTVEGLVPPLTRGRPDQLDDRAEEQSAAATFTGLVPGPVPDGIPGSRADKPQECDLPGEGGRFMHISPLTSPGLPAPLAWSLSQLAIDDLNAQRHTALATDGPRTLAEWAGGTVACA